MDIFLRWAIGAIVWTLANVVYLDLRRKGIRRGRFIAFFAGYPGTFISLFIVREGAASHLRPPPDDDDALLRDIHADRALREASEDDLGRGAHEPSGSSRRKRPQDSSEASEASKSRVP